MKIQGNDHFIPWCLNTISHTILRVPIYRYGHSITARLNLLLSNGWHPIVYCQGTRILFWLRGMIIKGSNHRWQAQIRWKKCWTTIHAFQELKQGNTEILGKVRTFWETHKIWTNLPCGFDKSADLLSKRQNHKEDFFKLCVLLKKSEL